MNLPLFPEQAVVDAATGGDGVGMVRTVSLVRTISQSPRQFSGMGVGAGPGTELSSARPPSPSSPGTVARRAAEAQASGRLQRAQLLLSFVQAHKGTLNLLVAARPSVLDASLASLIRCPQLRSSLAFENKRKYFYAQLKALRGDRNRRVGVHLQLRRERLFEDSFNQLRPRSADELRGRLQINFRGEDGIDAGGLTREWYIVISREIFNPNYALFSTVDGSTFQPCSQSMINNNHLDYFKFVGRIIGKAVCDQQLMDAHFTRWVWSLGVTI
jgi:E3 ubiquitin-protein ligase HUWE1